LENAEPVESEIAEAGIELRLRVRFEIERLVTRLVS
jgi:hypothetical protein